MRRKCQNCEFAEGEGFVLDCTVHNEAVEWIDDACEYFSPKKKTAEKKGDAK